MNSRNKVKSGDVRKQLALLSWCVANHFKDKTNPFDAPTYFALRNYAARQFQEQRSGLIAENEAKLDSLDICSLPSNRNQLLLLLSIDTVPNTWKKKKSTIVENFLCDLSFSVDNTLQWIDQLLLFWLLCRETILNSGGSPLDSYIAHLDIWYRIKLISVSILAHNQSRFDLLTSSTFQWWSMDNFNVAAAVDCFSPYYFTTICKSESKRGSLSSLIWFTTECKKKQRHFITQQMINFRYHKSKKPSLFYINKHIELAKRLVCMLDLFGLLYNHRQLLRQVWTEKVSPLWTQHLVPLLKAHPNLTKWTPEELFYEIEANKRYHPGNEFDFIEFYQGSTLISQYVFRGRLKCCVGDDFQGKTLCSILDRIPCLQTLEAVVGYSCMSEKSDAQLFIEKYAVQCCRHTGDKYNLDIAKKIIGNSITGIISDKLTFKNAPIVYLPKVYEVLYHDCFLCKEIIV